MLPANTQTGYHYKDSTTRDATFSGSHDAIAHACNLFYATIENIFSRIGDKNIVSFSHVVLAILNSVTYVPQAMPMIEGQVPWESLVTFLNTLGRSGSRILGSKVRLSLSH
jgi:hypothetical protein